MHRRLCSARYLCGQMVSTNECFSPERFQRLKYASNKKCSGQDQVLFIVTAPVAPAQGKKRCVMCCCTSWAGPHPDGIMSGRSRFRRRYQCHNSSSSSVFLSSGELLKIELKLTTLPRSDFVSSVNIRTSRSRSADACTDSSPDS